jgi:putative hemolysin
VPSTLDAMSLLEQFRASVGQMVFIVDEYGAVQGLVTVQDLLEAITGEFRAPASAESWAVQRPDGSWLLDGALPVSDLKPHLGWAGLPEKSVGRYQTLGGMLLVLMGRIPTAGESTEWEGWRLEVVDMDGKRVDKVLASRLPAMGGDGPPR